MNRAFGVQVTEHDAGRRGPAQPLAVVARDEVDAELVASRSVDLPNAQAEVICELSPDEVRSYGLDLSRHGQVRALPALNF